MNDAKQKLIISYLISSAPLFSLCAPILKPEYFTPTLKNAVAFIKNYADKYNAVPSPEQIKAETDIEVEITKITRDQIEYCASEVEKFCKEQALISAVLSSAALINEEDTNPDVVASKVKNLVTEASTISLHKDVGFGFTDDPHEMMERLRKRPKQPTGWKEFDYLMEGGISRQEMLLWGAPPKGGKSVTMQNLCLNLAEQGLPVLYISLELSVPVIWKRFAQMVSGVPSREILDRAIEVEHAIERLKDTVDLVIEQMPVGTRPIHVRSYLKEFELKRGYIPQAVAFDYIDLFYPNEKDVSISEAFTKDKLVSEQLRQILVDYDQYGTSASQLNRTALGEDVTTYHGGMIAGGVSKINTTDDLVAIYQSERMKAEGLISFQFLANRNVSVDVNRIDLAWDRNSLRITDLKKSMFFGPKGVDPKGKNLKLPNRSTANELIDMIPTQ